MAAFIRPTKTTKVSDTFHAHLARGSVNPGTDYVVGVGTPVVAVADATVVGVTTSISGAGGRMVWLDFGNGYKADYLHLSRIDVAKGQKVTQGQVLGLSGGSGKGSERGYGPHLHFAIRIGGKHVNGKGNFDYEAFLSGGEKPATISSGGRGTVKVGSKGEDVKYLQTKLGITADGAFGPNTKKAVVTFQKGHGLVADGIVGPMTWKALG
jgi:murein DD-endopeptidase MepM/ murein hydrolase activator NlpD